jgi:hypothetical protein
MTELRAEEKKTGLLAEERPQEPELGMAMLLASGA